MAAMLCNSGLHAAESTPSLAYVSDEIVVKSTRSREPKKKLTSNVTVIDKEDIASSPAKDLSELLAEQSVGYIHKYPGVTTAVGIRGFRTDEHGNDLLGRVLILLDGRRIGSGNISQIALENVERIEIIRGPASVQYGAAALGGIVNVITRKGYGSPSLSLEQKVGSNEYIQSIVTTVGKLGDFDFSGSISIADSGEYQTGSGTIFRNTDYNDLTRGSINLGYEFLPGHRIGLIYNHYESKDTGSPGYLSQNDLDDRLNSMNRSVDLSYEGGSSDDRFRWIARYYTGRDSYTEIDPVASNPGYLGAGWDDGLPYNRNTDYRGVQAQLTFRYEGLRITGGADWLNYDLDSIYTPTSSSYENPSVFLLASYVLFDDHVSLSGGLRYDDYKVALGDGLGGSRNADNVAANFGMAWKCNDHLKFRVNYAEGFKMQEAEQLAADYISSGITVKGNAALKPESSKSYEAGMDVVLGNLNSSLTVFKTDFSDKIQSSSSGSTKTWLNLGGASITGIETELSMNIPSGDESRLFSPYLNVVYLTDYSDDGTGEKLLLTPEWSSTVGMRVRDDSGFSGSFSIAYTGKTRVQVWEDWSGDIVTKGGFPVANLMLARKFTLGTQKGNPTSMTLSAEVNNLFDRNYEYVRGYSMPGRSLIVGLRLDI